MEQITLINHASVLIETDGIGLLSDPWYEGSAFSNGWELVSQTPALDISRVTHVWISHEHPDHFSPRTILRYFADVTNKPVFLYKNTNDKRVVTFLRRNGFEVLELENLVATNLNDKVKIISAQFGTDDSSLALVSTTGTFVNTNDCVGTREDVETLRRLCEGLPRVDYLLTQFALAGKVGNESDVQMRVNESRIIRQMALEQVKAINATDLIPIASFKFFSHRENFYMNAGNSTVEGFFAEATAAGVQMSVLYPGDSLEIGNHLEEPISERAVNRHRLDWSRIEPVEYDEKACQIEDLEEAGLRWANENLNSHNRFILRLLKHMPGDYSLRTIPIFLSDTGVQVDLSLSGVSASTRDTKSLYLSMSSWSLMNALKDTYGAMSLLINARIVGPPGLVRRFRVFAQLSTMRGSGVSLNLAWLLRSSKRLYWFLRLRRV